MARLAGIALVTDRFRHQPTVGQVIRIGPVLLGQALLTQRIDIADRANHVRPHLAQKPDIASVTVVLHHRENEFAVAVVLGDRIGATLVHAAGNPAVGGLMGRVPLQELPHLLGVTHAQQRRRSERPIANPGTGVGARARLDGGTGAIDQDVGQIAPDAVGDPPGGGWQFQLDPVQPRFPLPPGLLQQLVGMGGSFDIGRRPGTGLGRVEGDA